MYASDTSEAVGECSAPADAGGFVIELPEHGLILANAGGVYVEIETAADPHYDSTGLHRVHVNTCATAAAAACVALRATAGPSAGPPQGEGGVGVGAWWATADDAVPAALGNMSFADVSGATLSPGWTTNASLVLFTVEYFLLPRGVLVTEA